MEVIMKKEYTKPGMQVYKLQQTRLLCGSDYNGKLGAPRYEFIDYEDE